MWDSLAVYTKSSIGLFWGAVGRSRSWLDLGLRFFFNYFYFDIVAYTCSISHISSTVETLFLLVCLVPSCVMSKSFKSDWGHAKDYIKGMWLMVQRDEPGDYVLSTGECHSVKEFVEEVSGIIS